jgi:hypothetical protein
MPVERTARHARPWTVHSRRRAAVWLTTLAVMGIAVVAAAPWRVPAARGVRPLPVAGPADGRVAAISWPSSPRATPLAVATARKPLLSGRARRSCPRTADACVDLIDHLTWLQSDGSITYGPVPMEPGPPGTSHATPRGTFHVEWKAGAQYVSNIYGEPMPYAVFFAPGGIAFHGGNLTRPSHGCVHLSIGSARYYNGHLPAGAEVVVF